MSEAGRTRSQRLAPLDPSTLTAAQSALVAAVEQGPRARHHGRIGMQGPFGVWLRAPELGFAAQQFGSAVRFGTTLPEALKEIAICTVGAFFRARFEFMAHAPLARAAGVDPVAIEAIRTDATPVFPAAREQAAYALARTLVTRHRLSDGEYASMRAQFSEAELVELVTVIGYYCQISLTLNLFEVPLPEGAEDPFPDSADTDPADPDRANPGRADSDRM